MSDEAEGLSEEKAEILIPRLLATIRSDRERIAALEKVAAMFKDTHDWNHCIGDGCYYCKEYALLDAGKDGP